MYQLTNECDHSQPSKPVTKYFVWRERGSEWVSDWVREHSKASKPSDYLHAHTHACVCVFRRFAWNNSIELTNICNRYRSVILNFSIRANTERICFIHEISVDVLFYEEEEDQQQSNLNKICQQTRFFHQHTYIRGWPCLVSNP